MKISNYFSYLSMRKPLVAFLLALAASGCTLNEAGISETQSASVVARSSIPAGEVCEFGGVSISTGIDVNANGVLDDKEINETHNVCHGSDGLKSLISINEEEAGTHCKFGGTKIDSGLDINRNGVLDETETSEISYLCKDPLTTTAEGNIALIGGEDPSGITISLADTGIVAITDSNGDYTLSDIPQGKYEFIISPPAGSGYQVYKKSLTFLGDIPKTIADITLYKGKVISTVRYIEHFEYTPDSNAMVFTGRDSWEQPHHLYIKNKNATVPSLLTDQYVINRFKISNNSSTVVFITENKNLYSIPTSGGSAVLLAQRVQQFDLSNNSENVVFIEWKADESDPLTINHFLRSVPTTGGTVKALANKIGWRQTFKISPDSTRVAYRRHYIEDPSSWGMFTIGILGESPQTLKENTEVYSFEFTPDSSTIRFRANTGLYSVTPGNEAVLLSEFYSGHVVAVDSSRILVELSGEDLPGLYSFDLDGSNKRLLVETNPFIDEYVISGDSKFLAYTQAGSEQGYKLFIKELSNPEESKLIANSVDEHFLFSGDSEAIVFSTYSTTLAQDTGFTTTKHSSHYYSISSEESFLLIDDKAPYFVPMGPDKLIGERRGIVSLFSLVGEEPVIIGKPLDGYEVSPDNQKILYQANQNYNLLEYVLD